MKGTITYTLTDEAPALATASFLPILQRIAARAGITVQTADISLAARTLAAFGLAEDTLAALGRLAQSPGANIIKLPNISASVPQLNAAIDELRGQGFELPDMEGEKAYLGVLGSAVNPVLRQGNSDRRVALAVKNYARHHPHVLGAWSEMSCTEVASMEEGDFYGSEQSVVVDKESSFTIEFVPAKGETVVLKKAAPLEPGEVIDSALMSRRHLRNFFSRQMSRAKEEGLLLSLHLKATMMKVSDPIIFGHAVRTYFAAVFDKHAATFSRLGINPNNGLGELQRKIQTLKEQERKEIQADLQASLKNEAALAMVDSNRGITNLHVPSDVIIDASMPACIRDSGKMWNKQGERQDTLALIPDRSYAGIYQAVIDHCKRHGPFDPATMGSVANVGLMAKKAQEYGSHDKTFELPAAGMVRVVDDSGRTLMEHAAEAGDIFRMCQTKGEAIADWIDLAVSRVKATNTPAVFWLDPRRPHDQNLITEVERTLAKRNEPAGDVLIKSPVQAMEYTLERLARGQDTISVTGNVLRDYLTDLFPILELGTSAKMLSIVRLLKRGGLFETGAGGSAPKHVQQLLEKNHLRWDSLGEFLALAASLQKLGEDGSDPKAQLLARTLECANAKYLEKNKSPSRGVGQLDTRGSHFYLALYWLEALAAQKEDEQLAAAYAASAAELAKQETAIIGELAAIQGGPVDIGGYYRPDRDKLARVMRPCAVFNAIVDEL